MDDELITSGNYVLYCAAIREVVAVSDDYVSIRTKGGRSLGVGIDNLRPLRISEKLLKQFGFDAHYELKDPIKNTASVHSYFLDGVILKETSFGKYYLSSAKAEFTEIEYVHQLQNICSLLKVKLNKLDNTWN